MGFLCAEGVLAVNLSPWPKVWWKNRHFWLTWCGALRGIVSNRDGVSFGCLSWVSLSVMQMKRRDEQRDGPDRVLTRENNNIFRGRHRACVSGLRSGRAGALLLIPGARTMRHKDSSREESISASGVFFMRAHRIERERSLR